MKKSIGITAIPLPSFPSQDSSTPIPSSSQQLSLSATLNSLRNRRTLHDPRHPWAVQHPPGSLKRRKLPICHTALILFDGGFMGTAAWMEGDVDRVTMEDRDNARSFYGLGTFKEGSSCSSSPKTPYLCVPLSLSLPSGELCYGPENGEGELDSERQTRDLWSSPLPMFTANPFSLKLLPIPQHHLNSHAQNDTISRLPLPPCSPSAPSRF